MFVCVYQAGALVHIYKDGSVLVTHGGTEMGQGIHTKMQQVLRPNSLNSASQTLLDLELLSAN